MEITMLFGVGDNGDAWRQATCRLGHGGDKGDSTLEGCHLVACPGLGEKRKKLFPLQTPRADHSFHPAVRPHPAARGNSMFHGRKEAVTNDDR
jgi:hypothetical protein